MSSRLGFHGDMNNEYGDQIAKIAACRPALLVVLINPNEPGKAAPAINAARVSVIRHYPAEQTMRDTEALRPTDNAARYWQMIKPIVALYPNAYFAYWRNEVGDDALLHYHRDEMIAWIQVAEAEGFKVAVGNFSVGVPDFPKWASVLSPLMAKIHAVGPERAVLNLHEYGFGDMTTNAEYLALRHRKVWAENSYASRYSRVKVVIGETGLDRDDKSGKFGPYKAIGVSNQAYYNMLQDYDAELAKDPQVLGAAVYQWGREAAWSQYDIGGPVADSLVSYIQRSGTVPEPAPAPQPEPTPEPVPAGISHYRVKSPYLNIRQGPNASAVDYGDLMSGSIVTTEDTIVTGSDGHKWAKLVGYVAIDLMDRV